MLAELRALDPKPGLRFAQARVEVAVPDVHVRRAPDGSLDRRAQHRDAAAGAGQQRLRRSECVGETPATRASSRSAAPARAGWCAAWSSGRGRSSRSRARSSGAQERFFSLGVAELRPLTQRAVAAHARTARINRQSCRGRKIPVLRSGLLRVPLLFQLGDPGGLRRRGLLRGGGAGADSRPGPGGTPGRTAVGRQNRRPPER